MSRKSYFSKPELYSMPQVYSSNDSSTNIVGKLYTGEPKVKTGLKIKIPIPSELKEAFKKDCYLLDESYYERNYDLKLSSALRKNEIVDVLELINILTTKTTDGWIEKKGFFKEYPEWLEITLIEFLKQQGITIKNNKDDMFACLFISQRVLNKSSVHSYFNRENLIEEAEEIYFRYKSVMNCSPTITKICETFIDLGLEKIKYENGEIKKNSLAYSLTKTLF